MSPSVRSAPSLARARDGDGVAKLDYAFRPAASSDMDDEAMYCCLQGSPAWASSSSSPPSPSPSASVREGSVGATDLAGAASVVLIGETCTRADASKREEGLNLAVVLDADGRATSSSASTNTSFAPDSPSLSVNMLDAPPGSGGGSPNMPSPIMEEVGEWMNLKVEHIGDGLDLEDVKPSSEALGLDASYNMHNSSSYNMHNSSSCRRQNSCSEDAFMAQLDELLQSSTIELGSESAFHCVDDFFPAMSATHDLELPPSADYPASLGQWSMGSPHEHDASPTACAIPDFSHLSGSSDHHHDAGGESVIELFAQWLRSNAHCFSLGDLKKIKLKTSTIESATRRLGGGKKGLSQFLKFVLMWIQNCHMKRAGGSISSHLDGHGLSSLSAATSKLGASGRAIRDGAVQGDSMYNLPMEAVRHEKNSWSSLSQPASIPWSPRECNGGGFPLHNPPKRSPYAMSPSIPSVGSVDQTGWQRQQGNSTSAMMCGGLRPCMQDRMGVYNNTLSPTTAPSTSYSMASLGRPSTPAATTRAARKSRMERQRWSVRRHHHRSKAWTPSAPSPTPSSPCATAARSSFSSANAAVWPTPRSLGSPHMNSNLTSVCDANSRLAKSNAVDPLQPQGRKGERNLRLLFQKELKQSDVGSLGRIVLPKAAETSLPPLDLRDGVNLLVEDLNSPKMWTMRYRFWPNNKSRMYLLENTGDFVKSYDLKEGDYMMLYYNSSNNKYMIKGAKGECFNSVVSSHDLSKAATAVRAPSNSDFGYNKLHRSVSPKSCIDIFASDDSRSDDTLLAELIEQTLENVKDLPEILDVTS